MSHDVSSAEDGQSNNSCPSLSKPRSSSEHAEPSGMTLFIDRLRACQQTEEEFARFSEAAILRSRSRPSLPQPPKVEVVENGWGACGNLPDAEHCLHLLATTIEHISGLRHENGFLRQRCNDLESARGVLEMRLHLLMYDGSDTLYSPGGNIRPQQHGDDAGAVRHHRRGSRKDSRSYEAPRSGLSKHGHTDEALDRLKTNSGLGRLDGSSAPDGSNGSAACADKMSNDNVRRLKGTIERVKNKLKGTTPASPKPMSKRASLRTREGDSPDDRECSFVQWEINPPESLEDFGGVWLGYDESDYGGVWLGPTESSIPEQHPVTSECNPAAAAGDGEQTPGTAAPDGVQTSAAAGCEFQDPLQCRADVALALAARASTQQPRVPVAQVQHTADTLTGQEVASAASGRAEISDEGTVREGAKWGTPPRSPETKKQKRKVLRNISIAVSEKLTAEASSSADSSAVQLWNADAIQDPYLKVSPDPYLEALQKVEVTKEFARKYEEWSRRIAKDELEGADTDAGSAVSKAPKLNPVPPRSPGAPHRRWSTKAHQAQPQRGAEKLRHLPTSRSSSSLASHLVGSAAAVPHGGEHRGSLPASAVDGVALPATAPAFGSPSWLPSHAAQDAQASGGVLARSSSMSAERWTSVKPPPSAAPADKAKDKGKPSRSRFTQRVKRELEKRLTRTRERSTRSKSCERTEGKITDDFAEKLREWSVKQGHEPDYYGRMGSRARSTGSVAKEDDSSPATANPRTGMSDSSLEGAGRDKEGAAAAAAVWHRRLSSDADPVVAKVKGGEPGVEVTVKMAAEAAVARLKRKPVPAEMALNGEVVSANVEASRWMGEAEAKLGADPVVPAVRATCDTVTGQCLPLPNSDLVSAHAEPTRDDSAPVQVVLSSDAAVAEIVLGCDAEAAYAKPCSDIEGSQIVPSSGNDCPAQPEVCPPLSTEAKTPFDQTPKSKAPESGNFEHGGSHFTVAVAPDSARIHLQLKRLSSDAGGQKRPHPDSQQYALQMALDTSPATTKSAAGSPASSPGLRPTQSAALSSLPGADCSSSAPPAPGASSAEHQRWLLPSATGVPALRDSFAEFDALVDNVLSNVSSAFRSDTNPPTAHRLASSNGVPSSLWAAPRLVVRNTASSCADKPVSDCVEPSGVPPDPDDGKVVPLVTRLPNSIDDKDCHDGAAAPPLSSDAVCLHESGEVCADAVLEEADSERQPLASMDSGGGLASGLNAGQPELYPLRMEVSDHESCRSDAPLGAPVAVERELHCDVELQMLEPAKRAVEIEAAEIEQSHLGVAASEPQASRRSGQEAVPEPKSGDTIGESLETGHTSHQLSALEHAFSGGGQEIHESEMRSLGRGASELELHGLKALESASSDLGLDALRPESCDPSIEVTECEKHYSVRLEVPDPGLRGLELEASNGEQDRLRIEAPHPKVDGLMPKASDLDAHGLKQDASDPRLCDCESQLKEPGACDPGLQAAERMQCRQQAQYQGREASGEPQMDCRALDANKPAELQQSGPGKAQHEVTQDMQERGSTSVSAGARNDFADDPREGACLPQMRRAIDAEVETTDATTFHIDEAVTRDNALLVNDYLAEPGVTPGDVEGFSCDSHLQVAPPAHSLECSCAGSCSPSLEGDCDSGRTSVVRTCESFSDSEDGSEGEMSDYTDDDRTGSSTVETLSTASEELLGGSLSCIEGSLAKASSRPWRRMAHCRYRSSSTGNCSTDGDIATADGGTVPCSSGSDMSASSELALLETTNMLGTQLGARHRGRDKLSDRLRALAAEYASEEATLAAAGEKGTAPGRSGMAGRAQGSGSMASIRKPTQGVQGLTTKDAGVTRGGREAVTSLQIAANSDEIMSVTSAPTVGDKRGHSGSWSMPLSTSDSSAKQVSTRAASSLSIHSAENRKSVAPAAVHALVSRFENQSEVPRQAHAHTALSATWHVSPRTFVSPVTKLKTAAELMTSDGSRKSRSASRDHQYSENVSSSPAKRGHSPASVETTAVKH